jgi:hypothetical protein
MAAAIVGLINAVKVSEKYPVLFGLKEATFDVS